MAAGPANNPTGPSALHANQKGEFLRCLGEFFKRDLIAIPVVKKFPHSQLSQRCNLKAVTLELDTAAYPNIEYIAGTRLSVYPLNPANHVQAIMEHLVDDLDRHQVMVNNWSKFMKLNGKETLRLALTYLFDIMTAPSRELIRLLADACREKDQRKKLVAVSQTNESWERWLCSGHRTLKALFEEHNSCKVNASVLLNELNLQQPRQYSISNIKSAKRFRAEIVVVQHRFSLKQIELNLRQLRDRETYERTFSPTASSTSSPPPAPFSQILQQQAAANSPSPAQQQQLPVVTASPNAPPSPQGSKSNSRSLSQGAAPGSRSPAPGSSIKSAHTVKSAVAQSSTSLPLPVLRRPGPSTPPPPMPLAPPAGRSPSRPPQSTAAAVAQAQRNSSKGSQASNRSVRSMASFASSPITTHQVRRVSSFSGPLMSAYANATASQISSMSMISSLGGTGSGVSALERSGRPEPKSLLSVLESQNRTINSETGVQNAMSTSAPVGGGGPSPGHSQKYEGLCSNYLLALNSNDFLVCEFVENPRFTLKGNRERPIMLIGQDVGMIAYRAFWQQRHLEHDRAQVFYSLFKDLSPKKFGDMQLVCLTGHKGRVEELFKREIQQALASKILSSYTSINRKHLLAVLAAATNKSQLVLTQLQQQQSQITQQQQQQQQQQPGPLAIKSTMQQPQQVIVNSNQQNLPINSKELLELGDRIYKLLVENNGCLYTCCDPHMTQAIEILAFESIARNNSSLTREKLMKLLPKWKGRTQADERADETPAFFTLENTYERAAIVQEIYDSSI